MHCPNLLLNWLKCYNVISSHLATLVIMSRLMLEWIQYLHPLEKRHHFIILSHLQKLLVSVFWNNVGISYTNASQIFQDAFKLIAGNNEPIWHGWYPSHITVVDNTGKAWGTSSVIKGNDGVFAPPLCIFLWFYLSVFKFRLAKKLEKQTKKNRYFDITTNFEY